MHMEIGFANKGVASSGGYDSIRFKNAPMLRILAEKVKWLVKTHDFPPISDELFVISVQTPLVTSNADVK